MNNLVKEIVQTLEDSSTITVDTAMIEADIEYFNRSVGYKVGDESNNRYFLLNGDWYLDGKQCESPSGPFTIQAGTLITERQAKAVIDHIRGLTGHVVNSVAFALYAVDNGKDTIDPAAKEAWKLYGERGKEEYRDKARVALNAEREAAH